MANKNYDSKNPNSILKFARQLENRCLRDIIEERLESDVDSMDFNTDYQRNTGKGALGQFIESFYFGYDCNSRPEADFKEIGLELKVTPMKLGKKGEYLIKERLVCGMIDYNDIYKYPFEESSFVAKCSFMLILFYLHERDKTKIELIFKFATLWRIPAKDLEIMKNDYNIIINKIKAGKAHEISEGDTLYLGACTKGTKTLYVDQPFSEEKAKKRAFSLKPSYMRYVLNTIISKSIEESVVSEQELRNKSFEEIIYDKLSPFFGMSYDDLSEKFDLIDNKAKNKYALLVKRMLGISAKSDMEEFEKANIKIKTIRINDKNKCKEYMSFPNIDYDDLMAEDEWENSKLYEYFSNKFLFVIFKFYDNKLFLEKILFWTMPNSDLDVAEDFWYDIREKVSLHDYENFWKISDDKKFHVRPKGENSSKMYESNDGTLIPKKCYWFNKKYIESEILSGSF